MAINQLREKLAGLPPIYYINLDHRPEKRQHIERLIVEYGLKATRISAVDGRYPVDDYLVNKTGPLHLKRTELACSLSHLRAMHTWLSESDTETAMICEDDWCLDTVMYWPFSWSNVMESLPYYWDVFQCCITFHPQRVATFNIHPRELTDFSCVSYVVTRSYAQKLMSLYWRDNAWFLTYPSPYKLTAEELIYKPGVCFSIPLFTYTNEFESSIQTQEHKDQYHVPSRSMTLQGWLSLGNRNVLSLMPMVQLKIKA